MLQSAVIEKRAQNTAIWMCAKLNLARSWSATAEACQSSVISQIFFGGWQAPSHLLSLLELI